VACLLVLVRGGGARGCVVRRLGPAPPMEAHTRQPHRPRGCHRTSHSHPCWRSSARAAAAGRGKRHSPGGELPPFAQWPPFAPSSRAQSGSHGAACWVSQLIKAGDSQAETALSSILEGALGALVSHLPRGRGRPCTDGQSKWPAEFTGRGGGLGGTIGRHPPPGTGGSRCRVRAA
jgi:hypothetical protein